MATTTNYGWDTPDDTDLVKDGALAIRDLGQEIDTSLYSITNGENVGCVLLHSASYTSASTVTIDNVFSSDYRTYKVVLGVTTKTTNSNINLQLRRSGSTLAGATAYRLQSIRTYGANVDSFPNSGGTNLIGSPAAVNGGASLYYDIEVFDPTVTTDTHLKAQWFAFDGGSHVQALVQALYFESGAGNCDGLIFTAVAGSMTGFVRIYGYRN